VRSGCFADFVGRHVDLTTTERAALLRLEDRVRPLRRGAVLLRANDRTTDLFMLRRGVMMSYVLLDDGSRQILRFHFAGDLLGMSALALRASPETLSAMTEAEVCAVDRMQLNQLAVDHPRLATALMALDQLDRLALTDRLTALGRSSARSRVAALLVDIRQRMRAVDDTITDRFTLGLTQEEVGDATGLTAVHVNRMLRQLEDEGLIARENGQVTVVDETSLMRAANFVDHGRNVDLNWLPAGR
jgi:CRP/FNR family transcriptional regulator, anaerobic regulatory protein